MHRVFVLQTGYTALGEYEVGLASATMAAGLAAASDIYQFRTNVAGKVIAVHRIDLWATARGTGCTAGAFSFNLLQARSWSANGAGGVTATLTGGSGKLRQTSQLSVLTASGSGLRIADTVALTAGTRTLDAQGVRSVGGVIGANPFTALLSPSFELFNDEGRAPMVLEQNTGFVIQATVPATGTWSFGVSVRWSESGGYPY